MDFPLIALLTDFDLRDGFVGIMKGVIFSKLDTPVPVVDISHTIEPQNIDQAIWVLESALPYFPAQSIFVCIVDPGVGNPNQAALLCYWPEKRQFFIAPDNGLLTPVFDQAGEALQVYDIREAPFYKTDQLSLHGRSQTFHGRDVYAPVAALVANSLLSNTLEAFLDLLGAPLNQFVRIIRQPASQKQIDGSLWIEGEIIAADTFGNLITNIPYGWIPVGSTLSIHISGQTAFTCPVVANYSVVPALLEGGPILAIPSSTGNMELAIAQGNAKAYLKLSNSPFLPIRLSLRTIY